MRFSKIPKLTLKGNMNLRMTNKGTAPHLYKEHFQQHHKQRMKAIVIFLEMIPWLIEVFKRRFIFEFRTSLVGRFVFNLSLTSSDCSSLYIHLLQICSARVVSNNWSIVKSLSQNEVDRHFPAFVWPLGSCG